MAEDVADDLRLLRQAATKLRNIAKTRPLTTEDKLELMEIWFGMVLPEGEEAGMAPDSESFISAVERAGFRSSGIRPLVLAYHVVQPHLDPVAWDFAE